MSFEETIVRDMCDTLKYRSESVESGWERKRMIVTTNACVTIRSETFHSEMYSSILFYTDFTV